MKALQKAVMIPSEVEWAHDPTELMNSKYPKPGFDLMKNPFPKKKKKGKKKRKKSIA